MNKKRGIVMPGGRLLLTHKEIWAACLSHTNGDAVRERSVGETVGRHRDCTLAERNGGA